MILRKTRSRAPPSPSHSTVPPASKSSDPKPKWKPRPGAKACPSLPQQKEQHLLTTPTFTWDITKKDKQTIYNELGVTEMAEVGLGADRGPGETAAVNGQRMKRPSWVSGARAESKSHLVSPDQFKPNQEHIHNGQACSCKKQLVLDRPNGPFDSLSDEVVMGIFRWLPLTMLGRCASVCKHWNHLVFDDTLWRYVDVSGKIFGPGMLGRLLQRGTVAAKLSRSSFQGAVFDNKVMKWSSRTCKNAKQGPGFTLEAKPTLQLRYLDLTASDASPGQILGLLARCPAGQLQKVSLESCALSEGTLQILAEQSESLEELNLCMATGMKGEALPDLLERCTKLKCLNLSWTNLCRNDLANVVRILPPNMEKLNLSGFRQLLTNNDVIHLACMCPEMKELDLSDSTSIGFSAVAAIIDHMSQLQHIALSRCYNIPRLAFLRLGALTELRALDIFGLVPETEMLDSIQELLPQAKINIYPFSAIARPTTTKKRNNIWEVVCHE